MQPFNRLPAQTVIPKTQILKSPSREETVFYVPGRGANPPDENGKFSGEDAYQKAKSLANELNNSVILIPLSNHVGFFKGIEEVKGIFHRLVGTLKQCTTLFRQQHSAEEIKQAHEMESYFPAIKQAFNRN